MNHKITWWLTAIKQDIVFHHFPNTLLLSVKLLWRKSTAVANTKLFSIGCENYLNVNLLSFALLICKSAKLTSLSIKIKTTLAKEEIGQILSFVYKHEEQKYTNGSSVILHYGPLQALKIIQGAISSKVDNLPRIPSHTPLLSGEFRSKIFSMNGASGMISICWILSKFYPSTEKELNIPYFIFKDRISSRKKWPITMISKYMSSLSFGGKSCLLDSVFTSKYIPSFSLEV